MYVQEPTGKEWENCPAGDYQAVLCDLIDLGWQMDTFRGEAKGMVAKSCPVFQIHNRVLDDGLEPIADSENNLFDLCYPTPYGMSVKWSLKEGKESNWVKFLQHLFGARQGIEMAQSALENHDFSDEMILGANVLVTVAHVPSKDGQKTYANIVEMTRWRPNMGAAVKPTNYTHRRDRQGWESPEFPTDRAFPGDWMTGIVDEDYSPPQSAPQAATAPANDAAGTVTKEQKVLLLRESQRVYGNEAEGIAWVKQQLGDVNEASYAAAEENLTWLKKQPDFKAPLADESDDDFDDPFSDS